MPKDYIKISIDAPCKECWDSMQPHDIGKFCQKCQMEIYDFSDLTDSEIVEILAHAKGKVCGKFKLNQLNRALAIPNEAVKSTNPRYAKMLAATILLASLGGAGTILAQNTKNPTETIQGDSIGSIENKQEKTDLKDYQRIVKGQIREESTGEKVIGASILIKHTQHGVISDIDGNFEIKIPEENIHNNSVVITFFFLGYKSEERIITLPQKEALTINMKYDDQLILGNMTVTNYYSDPIYDNPSRKRNK